MTTLKECPKCKGLLVEIPVQTGETPIYYCRICEKLRP